MIDADDLDAKVKVTSFKTTKVYTLRELYNNLPPNFVDNRVRIINNLSDFTTAGTDFTTASTTWYLPYTYTQHLISSKESIA